MSKDYDAVALARREPVISETDRAAIGEAARRELRDRFAMAAISGIAGTLLPNPGSVKEAWEWADMMLKARGND